MQIALTKKVSDKFKIKALEMKLDSSDDLFCWHANTFTYQRKTGIILMNDMTRYTIVLYDIKKKEFKNLKVVMLSQLESNMLMDGISNEKIKEYLDDLEEIIYIKTSSRSILGQIKDSLLMLEYHLYDIGTVREDKLDYLNNIFNDVPMRALEKLGYRPFPNLAMKTEIDKRY